MTKAHIVLGLEHSSLVSKENICEADYKVVFDEQECRVYYKDELVLSRGRVKRTDIWKLWIDLVSKNKLEGLDLLIPAPRRGIIT